MKKKVMKVEVKVEVKNALWEATKEPLRLLVLAVVPVLVTLAADLPKEYAYAAILVLRFVDSYLHNLGKVNGNEKQIKGLTQF